MDTEAAESFEKLLIETLLCSEERQKTRDSGGAASDHEVFSPRSFFERWFLNEGHAYFFLFKKNLRVTNIQLAELFALICTFNRAQGTGEPIRELQFHNVSVFNKSIEGLVNSFQHDPDDPRQRYQDVERCFGSILRRAVAVDIFQGSCAVFIPPHFDIDLEAICAHSGYIHSCGLSAFVRQVPKARKVDFIAALDRHLQRYPFQERKGFFSVYAHEDFTGFDREVAGELRHGLDDVKIYIEKFFMGPDSLVSVLKEMAEHFRGQFEIPEPGDYTKKHKNFRVSHDIDQSRTLWLIVDRAVDQNATSETGKMYYICYDQRYYNANPFHLFDENKPAWIAHTTIPHTLAGAMINITRPYWPPLGKVVLADPFAGTGTTLLETLKDERLQVYCGDIEPIAPLLAADNAYFFSASPAELETYLVQLGEILGGEFDPDSDSVVAQAYSRAGNMAKQIRAPGADASTFFSDEAVNEFASRSVIERLLLYIALRTALRHIAAFDREAENWLTAFRRETGTLATQMESLKKLRERKQTTNGTTGPVITLEGDYSVFCSLRAEAIGKWRTFDKAAPAIRVMDARRLPPDSCDVIICDPPYGFNIEHDATKLAVLYAEVIRTMIRALRDEGQLVLCVPEHSYTGRPLVYYTDKGVIIQQVLTIAEECHREVVMPAKSLPHPAEIMRAPYYWESERALRRSILHFRLKDDRLRDRDAAQ